MFYHCRTTSIPSSNVFCRHRFTHCFLWTRRADPPREHNSNTGIDSFKSSPACVDFESSAQTKSGLSSECSLLNPGIIILRLESQLWDSRRLGVINIVQAAFEVLWLYRDRWWSWRSPMIENNADDSSPYRKLILACAVPLDALICFRCFHDFFHSRPSNVRFHKSVNLFFRLFGCDGFLRIIISTFGSSMLCLPSWEQVAKSNTSIRFCD